MDFNFNYRIGLIIQRNGYIDTVNSVDIVNLNQIPPKRSFDPIFLNDNIFGAYGFIKSAERYKGHFYFQRNDIVITQRPFTDKYHCPNFQVTINIKYLHELQDFFEYIYGIKATAFTEFVVGYGSRKLSVYDE
jgi:hypothetical protein